MGLFDLFKGAPKGDKQDRPKGNPAAKWADRVEKRAQNYDRQEAIQALAEMGTPEAVEVLLKRFTFHMDPSITDQEEKDAAFRGILRAGKDAIPPVRAFAASFYTGWGLTADMPGIPFHGFGRTLDEVFAAHSLIAARYRDPFRNAPASFEDE